MQDNPLVSVLMTSYNREKYIGEAIESVLQSSYKNFELIIVDDGSKDNTVEIAKKYESRDNRIKVYVNEKNLGDYPNRNQAAKYATGKYLKYLDSDDLLYKHSLQVYVDFMESNPDVAYAVTSAYIATNKPFPHVFNPSESLRYHFFQKHFLDCAPTGAIYKTKAFHQIGGFSGKNLVGDIEIGLKMATRFNAMILPPGLVFWREHGNQEVFYGINNNLYPALIKNIFSSTFNEINDDILSKDEINLIWKKYKKNNIRDFIKKILTKY